VISVLLEKTQLEGDALLGRDRLLSTYSVEKLQIGHDVILLRSERTSVDASLTRVQADGRVRDEASAAT
jgi:hypothetical protein